MNKLRLRSIRRVLLFAFSRIVCIVFKMTNVSLVWSFYFEKTMDGASAMCKTCTNDLQIKYSNTSNLRTHLGRYHPNLFKELEEKEKSADAANKKATNYQQIDAVFAKTATKYSQTAQSSVKLTTCFQNS